MKKHGSCLCGDVKFSFEPTEPESAACHCGMCRKWTGGVFVSVEVQQDRFVLERKDSLTTYASSPWAERAFCSHCGSSLWYRVTAPGPHVGNVYVGLGTLDDTQGLDLKREIFIDQKPANYSFAEATQQLTETEVMAQFSGAQ